MPYVIWKFIRNTTIFFAVFIFLLLFSGLLINLFGENVLSSFLLILSFLSFIGYFFSFRRLRKIILFFVFFPISLFFLDHFRMQVIENCNRCKRPFTETGVKIHSISKSKGYLVERFNLYLFDVSTGNELRCNSTTCYPRKEFFNTIPRLNYTLLSKKSLLRRFHQDGHHILNLDIIDV
jgi:hypothetical protein